MNIDQNSVIFDPASTVDSFGRVFHYQDEVYRAITPNGAPQSEIILQMADKWETFGLVKTRRSELTLKGYPLTIWHEKIPYQNYCMEWLPEMLKDAALQFLRLNLQLIKDGYMTKDGHPWNIFFQRWRPVFIDIGSIVPFDKKVFQKSMQEFRSYFWLPLIMFAKEGCGKTYDFLKLPIPNHKYRNSLANEMHIPSYVSPKFLPERFGVKRLIRQISRMEIDYNKSTTWSNYNQREISIDEPQEFPEKQGVVYKFISTLTGGSLLDIGSNKGWFSRLANSLGFNVIAIDNDIPSLTRLYQMAKRERLNILPLYVDFSKPTESHGLKNGYPSFEDRIHCDVVLAMAMVHHLTYKSKMTFEEISRRMGKLSKRYAVVEFIPKEDYYVSKWDHTGMEWYNSKCFIEAFMKEFKNYKVFPSSPSPREIYIFEK